MGKSFSLRNNPQISLVNIQMKKTISILSALALVFSLSGCQENKNADISEAATNSVTESGDIQENTDTNENSVAQYSTVNPGDVITFGQYEQDNNSDNGAEPIEWDVLSVDGDDVFVWSRKVLDNRFYNEERTDVTWETCTLRKWLNEEFYQTAFSASEQSAILKTTNHTPDNEKTGVLGGNDTEDYVFMLSEDEVCSFYAVDSKMSCPDLKIYPTQYAHEHGNYVNQMYAIYWLRTPGSASTVDGTASASVFTAGGDYGSIGECFVDYEKYGVRPAMHLSLSSLQTN